MDYSGCHWATGIKTTTKSNRRKTMTNTSPQPKWLSLANQNSYSAVSPAVNELIGYNKWDYVRNASNNEITGISVKNGGVLPTNDALNEAVANLILETKMRSVRDSWARLYEDSAFLSDVIFQQLTDEKQEEFRARIIEVTRQTIAPDLSPDFVQKHQGLFQPEWKGYKTNEQMKSQFKKHLGKDANEKIIGFQIENSGYIYGQNNRT